MTFRVGTPDQKKQKMKKNLLKKAEVNSPDSLQLKGN
jgi:hypothetical protein